MIELLAFEALLYGGWWPGLLHSVLEEIHVEAFVEKAGGLVGVGEVDFDKSCWLLRGFTDDVVYSGDVDSLVF